MYSKNTLSYVLFLFSNTRRTMQVETFVTFWIGRCANGLAKSDHHFIHLRPYFERHPLFQCDAGLFRLFRRLWHPFQAVRDAMNMRINTFENGRELAALTCIESHEYIAHLFQKLHSMQFSYRYEPFLDRHRATWPILQQLAEYLNHIGQWEDGMPSECFWPWFCRMKLDTIAFPNRSSQFEPYSEASSLLPSDAAWHHMWFDLSFDWKASMRSNYGTAGSVNCVYGNVMRKLLSDSNRTQWFTLLSAFGSAHLWQPIVSTGAPRSKRITRKFSRVSSQFFGIHLACFDTSGSSIASIFECTPSRLFVSTFNSPDFLFLVSFSVDGFLAILVSIPFLSITGNTCVSPLTGSMFNGDDFPWLDRDGLLPSFSYLIWRCFRWFRVCNGEKYGEEFSDLSYKIYETLFRENENDSV